jgi:hypothetical protein
MITPTTNNQDQYNIAFPKLDRRWGTRRKHMVLAFEKSAHVPTHISDMVLVSLVAHHTVIWITVSVRPPHMI